MALNSCDIDQQLRNAADDVVGAKRNLSGTRSMISAMITQLDGMATKYSAMIAVVNAAGYGVPANEAANKARLAGIITDFTALRADAIAASNWMSANTTEF